MFFLLKACTKHIWFKTTFFEISVTLFASVIFVQVKSNSPKVSLKESFWFWLKLGFISFGGPAGQIAIMHEYLVEKKKWIEEEKFLHALNFTMFLPGPEAQQLATYCGWLLNGYTGGIIAGSFFVLPSMFILLMLSIVYVKFGSVPPVEAAFNLLKPTVLAIVILALVKIGKKALISKTHTVVAILAGVALTFFKLPFPVIIFSSMFIGFAISKLQANKIDFQKQANQAPLLNYRQLFMPLFIGALLWLAVFMSVKYFLADYPFYTQMSLFFTKTAFITFGGAYAVLPYVADVSVNQLSWLSAGEMIDGLALGESTPGPLVMVLVFVGFMGGYNQLGHSLFHASFSLILSCFFIFLPCFVLVFSGAPLIERTHNNPTVKTVFSFVTAAVVGVIFSLCIFLAKAALLKNGVWDWNNLNLTSIIWLLVSLVVLYRFKLNVVYWIVISILCGMGLYFIQGVW